MGTRMSDDRLWFDYRWPFLSPHSAVLGWHLNFFFQFRVKSSFSRKKEFLFLFSVEKNNFPGKCHWNARIMLNAFASLLKCSKKCQHNVQKPKYRCFLKLITKSFLKVCVKNLSFLWNYCSNWELLSFIQDGEDGKRSVCKKCTRKKEKFPGVRGGIGGALLGGGGGGRYPCPLSEIRHQPCRHFARFLCRLSEFRLRGVVSGNLTLFD